jgi:hypothetical protein
MSDTLQTQLPDNVLDFMSDVAAIRFAEKFVKMYGLKDEDVTSVMSLAEEVAYGDLSVSNLPDELIQRFQIDPSKAKQAALEIAEARLLPIKEVVPGVAQQIRAWGGEVAQDVSTESAGLSPFVFVQTSLQDVLKEMPDYLQGRLAHILELYVSKHSDADLILDMLTRSEKVGGADFDKEDAEALLKYVDEKMIGQRIVEDDSRSQEVEKPRSEEEEKGGEQEKKKNEPVIEPVVLAVPEIPKPQVVQKPIASVIPPVSVVVPKETVAVRDPLILPLVKGEVTQQVRSVESLGREQSNGVTKESRAEDAHEIEMVKTKKQTAMETPVAAPGSIEEMVGQICALEPMQLSDGTLVTRCKQIVESRFREVRNAADTQKQIERPVETGGLGISGRKLADMMQAIENGMDVFIKHASEKVAQDRASYLEKKQLEQTQKQTLSGVEEKMMTKRYVELTGKMPTEHVSPAAPDASRASAAVSKDAAMTTREQNINTEKVRGVIEAAKQNKDLSPVSSQRPHVQDVTFVKKLSGPIDELHGLSLVDFRRMAKNIDQSAERIIDLVHLVEDQGYEKRVEAIRAWQSSPLYLTYLDIARKAMQEGKPLEEMRTLLSKTAETLTKEELAVILKLNNELRF